jgi:hypothetical protein
VISSWHSLRLREFPLSGQVALVRLQRVVADDDQTARDQHAFELRKKFFLNAD